MVHMKNRYFFLRSFSEERPVPRSSKSEGGSLGEGGSNLFKSRSFTLIELLVVVAIIAILSGMLLPAAMQAWSKSYVKKAEAAISALEVAINMYKTDIGYYPDDSGSSDCHVLITALTSDAGGNWHGPYMSFKTDELDSSDNFLDPWGTSYIYEKPGTNNTNSYDLSSYGPDGADDSGGDDDIINW
jgi:general secretion pathway protein G